MKRPDLDDPMSATLQQDCYAALWCSLFRSTHGLDRYAGQRDLFNRDQGEPEPQPIKPDNFPDVPRDPTMDYRERLEVFPHKRDARGARALQTEMMKRHGTKQSRIEDLPEGGTAIRVLSATRRLPASPQPTGTPKPAFTTEGPLATQDASLVPGQPTPPRRDEMFPHITRDPKYHWMPRTSLVPTEKAARELADTEGDKPGFHVGEVVPEGNFWRVNRLYRFPRVQYPQQ